MTAYRLTRPLTEAEAALVPWYARQRAARALARANRPDEAQTALRGRYEAHRAADLSPASQRRLCVNPGCRHRRISHDDRLACRDCSCARFVRDGMRGFLPEQRGEA